MSRKKHLTYPLKEGTYKVPQNIPHKKYGCVVIDAPWKTNQTGTKWCASQIYPVLNTEEIMQLPVPELLEDNAFVWFWVNNGLIADGVKILEHWGLRVLSVLSWVKPTLGLGVYLRTSSELCILAAKGKPKFKCHSQSSVLYAPNMGHSTKPDEIFVIAERACEGPYLELFARRVYNQDRWDVWGDSVPRNADGTGGSDIFLPGWPVPSYSFDRSFWDPTQTPEYKMQRIKEAKEKRNQAKAAKAKDSQAATAKVAKEPTVTNKPNQLSEEVIPLDSGKSSPEDTAGLLNPLPLRPASPDGALHAGSNHTAAYHRSHHNLSRVDSVPGNKKPERPVVAKMKTGDLKLESKSKEQ